MEWPTEKIAELIDGDIPWDDVKRMISEPKDLDRFDKTVEILQSRVPWSDPILLPYGEHLFIVQTANGPIVKCDCGHEFGDYRENWKFSAVVYVRRDPESYAAVGVPELMGDPEWSELREYYCPGCATQLEVEAVTPGYPILFSFKPDLEAFYKEWLKRPIPTV